VDPILIERQDGIVTATLNRPAKLNAIDTAMWRALVDLADEVQERHDDRVLVITGAGGGFCAGADLSVGAGPDDGSGPGGLGSALAGMRQVGRAALRLHLLSKPTIAAVNGVAAGAGCNLALGCDLIIASDRARFSEIFAKRGLSIDFGGSWVLPRLVGLHRAKELVFTADVIDAVEADRIGLVNRVVPHDELLEHTRSIARRIAALAPNQIAISKRLLQQSYSVTMAEALEFEGVAQAASFASADTVEAMRAFAERREPRFTGA
jgi:2-(1,2-epoxy-1,2-dihydrophenyl)acetyl-CoA isomerase